MLFAANVIVSQSDYSHSELSSTLVVLFFFQAEDGIRDLVRSRGLGDVYKRQGQTGTEEVDVWFDAETGLPLRNRRVITVSSDSLILSLIHI